MKWAAILVGCSITVVSTGCWRPYYGHQYAPPAYQQAPVFQQSPPIYQQAPVQQGCAPVCQPAACCY